MNLSKAYQSGTVPRTDEPVKQTEVNPDEVEAQQLVAEWRRSKVTRDFVQKTNKQIAELLDETVQLASQNHQTNNTQLIVKKLIQVETLRKVVSYHAN